MALEYGQLDNIEDRIDSLVTEWTNTLINTITDPWVLNQKEYLNAKQAETIDNFVASGQLSTSESTLETEFVMASGMKAQRHYSGVALIGPSIFFGLKDSVRLSHHTVTAVDSVPDDIAERIRPPDELRILSRKHLQGLSG